ncbi:uncharacterized protein LOC135166401 isoform X2 [Diachasmimorpha longicaudata]|uniref:uncharacterized protein LOC135166401 isoform X2 n=1 Tax=Diachasmimorpha longicaudata TaxID=58733 RepID=UPI0030B90679
MSANVGGQGMFLNVHQHDFLSEITYWIIFGLISIMTVLQPSTMDNRLIYDEDWLLNQQSAEENYEDMFNENTIDI